MSNYVTLTDEEIVLLDGRCSEKVQKDIDGAKLRLEAATRHTNIPPTAAALIADVIAYAKTNGKLGMRYENIPQCRVCQTKTEYHIHPKNVVNRSKYRASYYKYRAGEIDYESPKMKRAIDLSDGFIVFKNRVALGCCVECFDKYIRTKLQTELENIPCEHTIFGPTKWFKSPNKVCKSCKAEFHEREMGRQITVMGDGYYYASCPKCKAENGLFRHGIDNREGFVMVDATHSNGVTK